MTQAGVERQALASYVPDLDAAGRVKGFFVLVSDVTELAAARNELRKEHARLEAAIDGSGVVLWDTDLRTGRVYLSDAWAGIVGGPRGDRVATTDELVGITHPDDIDDVRRLSLEVMKGSRAVYAIEHRVRGADGEWRWIISRGRVTERERATDTVARFGGDEFVVLLEDVRERENAVRVAEKIVADCRQPLRIDGRDIVATASIGLAYGGAADDEEALIKRADAALYDAKRAGRNCFRLNAGAVAS